MSNNKTGEMSDTPTPPQGEEVIRQALSDDILRDREGNDARLGAVPDSDSIAALVSQNEDLRDAVKRLTAELTALRLANQHLEEVEMGALKAKICQLREEMEKRQDVIDHQSKSIWQYSEDIRQLRSQLSEAQENYEKVWDAAEHRIRWERDGWHYIKHQHEPPPPDKTTFINKIKKGKE
jgi:predicted RNase H-like nuclease (RuvC/YqgF family)